MSSLVVHAVAVAEAAVVDVVLVEDVLVEEVELDVDVELEVDELVVEDDPEALGLELEQPASTPPTARAPAASIATRFNNI